MKYWAEITKEILQWDNLYLCHRGLDIYNRMSGHKRNIISEGTWTSSYHLDAIITETYHSHHGSRASCQIRKFGGSHAPGMSETFSTPSRVSDPDMHHVRDTRVVMHAGITNSRWDNGSRLVPLPAAIPSSDEDQTGVHCYNGRR